MELSYLCSMNYNFLYSNSFERKFNRKPKEWTIEQIHALYEKAKERSNKRWKSRRRASICSKSNPRNSKSRSSIYRENSRKMELNLKLIKVNIHLSFRRNLDILFCSVEILSE